MRKLDPALYGIVDRRRERDARRAATADAPADEGPPAAPATVSVAVKFTGDLDDLLAVGFEPITTRRHPTEGWTLSAGTVPVDRLEELDDVDHVVKVEGARPLHRELNDSVPEIGADVLHEAATPFKGQGVVVGIIDSGIDWAHQCFRRPDGTSRIIGLWDQSLTPTGTETSPAGFGFGVAYTKADIDAALAPGGTPLNTSDSDGHGTHVAGIAAGDGSQAGNCRGDFTFVGVAPEADIIVVALTNDTGDVVGTDGLGESINLIHALDFIWHHPAVAGRPVVVNISLGDNLGPHDGTSAVEQFIDLDLTEASRAVVKSAGNEGNDDRHAVGTAPAGDTLALDFEVREEDRTTRHIELWYDGAAALDVVVRAPAPPGGAAPASPPTSPGDARRLWPVDATLPANRQTIVRIDSRTNDFDNGDNWIRIEIDGPSRGWTPAGPWAIELTNDGADDVEVHAWIQRGRNSPRFTSDVTRAGTISVPGTSASVITVGAYDMGGFLTAGGLAPFSSFGPTRDGRQKPDIVAPGVGITSARAGKRGGCCCDCCYDFYVDEDGTSMSAPHVTGTVALMFQKNRGLTAAEVKEHLVNGVRLPGGVDPLDLPNSEWGAGELDAQGAVDEVPPPGGDDGDDGDVDGGGGGGGGPRHRLSLVDAGTLGATGPSFGGPTIAGARLAGPGAAGLGALLALHGQVAASADGARWAALVSRHFSEVRGLVNANRKVAMRWHRLQGPALLRVLGHAAVGAPAGVVLPAVDADELPRRLVDLLAVLERYGSPALAADARRIGAVVATLDAGALTALAAVLPSTLVPAPTPGAGADRGEMTTATGDDGLGFPAADPATPAPADPARPAA